ncbi:MAG: hypothetical protein ACOYKQ_01925 [Polymorphobacter sp.]
MVLAGSSSTVATSSSIWQCECQLSCWSRGVIAADATERKQHHAALQGKAKRWPVDGVAVGGEDMSLTNVGEPASADAVAQLTDLRAANLQLQATIDCLRAELETTAAATAAAVQRAQQAFSDEISQLKETAAALREAMEAQAAAAAASEQAVRATAETDLGQLRAAVSVLRTELENERQRGEAATAASVAAMQQERTTLHDQIQTLRQKLETIA